MASFGILYGVSCSSKDLARHLYLSCNRYICHSAICSNIPSISRTRNSIYLLLQQGLRKRSCAMQEFPEISSLDQACCEPNEDRLNS